MILISACLLGCACRYDGKSKPHPLAQALAARPRRPRMPGATGWASHAPRPLGAAK